jgi:guanosine-3',5'-bis(diphosphate) 3'-pyrophosphohydrolase
VVNRAYEYAKKMHDGQTRSSGEPYYTHPMEVAGLLANMKMDTATIVTAILHDTLEDTKATFDEVKAPVRRGSRQSRQRRQQAFAH